MYKKSVKKNKMKNKPHISYEQLLEIISWGIFSMKMKGKSVYDSRLKKMEKIEGATYGGIYVGSPGRDIHYMLPYIDNKQMKEAAALLCDRFPAKPPKTYANVAACIRFIYGQFDKQGVLRSEKDFQRIKKEKLEWGLPRIFLKLLEDEFKKINNYYGLSMLCEIEGHRLGDEAIIGEDVKKIEAMEKKYNKCIEYAHKCKGYKHMFSMYYWASLYFIKFGDIQKAVKYAKLSIKNASKYYHKYFPGGENYYSVRLKEAFSYIEKNDRDDWLSFKNRYKKHIESQFKSKIK